MTRSGGQREAEQALPMRRPLLALGVFFAMGIWLPSWVDLPSAIPWIVVGLLLPITVFLVKNRQGGVLRFYLWLGLFLSLGWARGMVPVAPSLEAPTGAVVLAGLVKNGWHRVDGGLQVVLSSCAIGEPGGELKASWPGMVRMTVLLDQAQEPCPDVLPGDELRALVRLGKPRAKRNYGVRDSRQTLYSKGIYWTAFAGSCHDLLVSRKDTLSLSRLAQKARYALDRIVSTAGPDDASARAVFAALSFGETGYIPSKTRLAFQRSGLAHLLAVSGLHLGTVAIGLYLLLSFVLCRVRPIALRVDVRRIAAIMVIPAVAFYVLLVGARLPAIRAGVVISCFLLAIILRRRSDSVNVLSAAWMLVLGLWPRSLFEASFQLSFAAAFSVILFTPRWASWAGASFNDDARKKGLSRKIKNRILQLLLVSAAATVGTAPIVAWHFHQLSLIGLFSNLLAVPLASWLIVPVGIFSAIGLAFSHALAGSLASAGIWLCQGLDWFAKSLSSISWASLNIGQPGVVLVSAWYIFFVLASFRLYVRKFRLVALLAAVIVCIGVSWQLIGDRFSDQLRLNVIDVGQGDCLLVRFPGGSSWLVDGGGSYSGKYDVGMRVVAPALWALGVDKLQVVIATHRDPDHVGGLPSVIELFRPEEVWSSVPLAQDAYSRPVAQAARSIGAKMRILHAGSQIHPVGGVSIQVLWPPEDSEGYEENERSLVLRLSYGKQSMLLTGDLEKSGEDDLLHSGIQLGSNLLKVGHHGSANATSSEFVKAVDPAWAVISVGERNHFGLPRKQVIERLDAAGVKILRTDLDGQVSFSTDGQNMKVRTWRRGNLGD